MGQNGQNGQNQNQNQKALFFFFLFVWSLTAPKVFFSVIVLPLPLDENLISPMTFLLTLR